MREIIQNAFIILLAISFLMVLPALGQTGGPYGLTWSTIDGGGTRLIGY